METTLIGLLVLALALGGGAIFWLRLRLNRLEEELRDFRPLSLVPDRLNALVKAVEAFDREEILHEIARIQEGLDRVESLSASPAQADAPAPTQAEAVAELSRLSPAEVAARLFFDEQPYRLPYAVGIHPLLDLATSEKLLGLTPRLFRYFQNIILSRPCSPGRWPGKVAVTGTTDPGYSNPTPPVPCSSRRSTAAGPRPSAPCR